MAGSESDMPAWRSRPAGSSSRCMSLCRPLGIAMHAAGREASIRPAGSWGRGVVRMATSRLVETDRTCGRACGFLTTHVRTYVRPVQYATLAAGGRPE